MRYGASTERGAACRPKLAPLAGLRPAGEIALATCYAHVTAVLLA